MRPIDYEALVDKLIEDYPLHENPQIYNLYTEMLNFLMKVFRLKRSTAVKLLLKVEEKMGIHLVRDHELTNMKMLNLKKDDDVKKYFRTIYWYHKLPLETVDAIYKKYNNINASIVKKFLKENGDMSENKYSQFTYAQQYYQSHKEELKEKKREYRHRKRLEKTKLSTY